MDHNIGRLIDALKAMEILDNTFILFLPDNGAGNAAINNTPDTGLGSRNFWVSNEQSCGNVSNTPYRYYKAFAHEGGIITPLIVHWPNGIDKKGLISHQPIHIIDIVPTLLGLSKTVYPETFGNEKLVPITGKSILPLINGAKKDQVMVMFWQHEGNQAVRIGDWKLVKKNKNPWESYDLKTDPNELSDLKNIKSDLIDSLKINWQTSAKKVGVKDWPVK